MGLPVDGFEEEILVFLRRLELCKKGKAVRQGLKKGLLAGSKLGRELQKLECFVKCKSDLINGRRRGKSIWELAKVCQ